LSFENLPENTETSKIEKLRYATSRYVTSRRTPGPVFIKVIKIMTSTIFNYPYSQISGNIRGGN